MMRCPICNKSAHIRTSRYLSEQTKESYYQCQNITCSCTFKSIESISKIISSPLQNQEANYTPTGQVRTMKVEAEKMRNDGNK